MFFILAGGGASVARRASPSSVRSWADDSQRCIASRRLALKDFDEVSRAKTKGAKNSTAQSEPTRASIQIGRVMVHMTVRAASLSYLFIAASRGKDELVWFSVRRAGTLRRCQSKRSSRLGQMSNSVARHDVTHHFNSPGRRHCYDHGLPFPFFIPRSNDSKQQ